MMITRIAAYKHFGRCLFVSNGVIQLILPLEFGIRVLSYGFSDETNVLFEQPAQMTDFTTPDGWRLYGGHRLWLSPESEKSYFPDIRAVTWSAEDDTIRLTQTLDDWLGVEKELDITMSAATDVTLVHRITNRTDQTMEISVWAITTLAAGGVAVVGTPNPHDIWSPAQCMATWAGTNPDDDRLAYSAGRILLKQKPAERNLKIGLSRTLGLYTYKAGNMTFVKSQTNLPGLPYPDGGMCFEAFICTQMLELETLSPVYPAKPGESVEHIEIWHLERDN